MPRKPESFRKNIAGATAKNIPFKIRVKAFLASVAVLISGIIDKVRKKITRQKPAITQNVSKAMLVNMPLHQLSGEVLLQSPVGIASRVNASMLADPHTETAVEFFNGDPVVFHSEILEPDELVKSVNDLDYFAVQEVFHRIKALNSMYKGKHKNRKSYTIWEDSGKRLKIDYVVTSTETT